MVLQIGDDCLLSSITLICQNRLDASVQCDVSNLLQMLLMFGLVLSDLLHNLHKSNRVYTTQSLNSFRCPYGVYSAVPVVAALSVLIMLTSCIAVHHLQCTHFMELIHESENERCKPYVFDWPFIISFEQNTDGS